MANRRQSGAATLEREERRKPRERERTSADGGASAQASVDRSNVSVMQMQSLIGNRAVQRRIKSAREAGAVKVEDIQRAAALGVKGSGSKLPHLNRIQASFGRHDVTGVRAHTDNEARQASEGIGAVAYAMGDHVAMTSTDLYTSAHEAAHIVQQRAGVVPSGVSSPGDRWERHADAVADRVVRGESAEGLMSEAVGRSAAVSAPPAGASAGGGGSSVQMIRQPASGSGHESNTNEYYQEMRRNAVGIAPAYYQAVTKFAERTGGTASLPYEPGTTTPQLKGGPRIAQKVASEYGGDYSQLVDLLRGMVVYNKISNAVAAAKVLASGVNLTVRRRNGNEVTINFHAERLKARIEKVPYDFLANVRMKIGSTEHVCELQLQITEILDFKDKVAHPLYEVARDPDTPQPLKDALNEKLSGGYAAAKNRAANKPSLPGALGRGGAGGEGGVEGG